MEQVVQNELSFVGSAWPARIGGICIFIVTLVIYFLSSQVKIFIPLIAGVFMILAILFAADVRVVADKTKQILSIGKKRILNSTYTSYPFSDIIYLQRNTSFSTNTNNKQEKRIKYTIALKGQTSARERGGYLLIPFSIPSGWYTMFSSSLREVQEFTNARVLANFIGVPLYEKGGENDMLANVVAAAPQVLNKLKDLPGIFAKVKEENDKKAQEILGNKDHNY